MKRYLRIFILTVIVGLSGCASDTDSDTQVSSRAYSMQMQQNQNRVQTFNGRRHHRMKYEWLSIKHSIYLNIAIYQKTTKCIHLLSL